MGTHLIFGNENKTKITSPHVGDTGFSTRVNLKMNKFLLEILENNRQVAAARPPTVIAVARPNLAKLEICQILRQQKVKPDTISFMMHLFNNEAEAMARCLEDGAEIFLPALKEAKICGCDAAINQVFAILSHYINVCKTVLTTPERIQIGFKHLGVKPAFWPTKRDTVLLDAAKLCSETQTKPFVDALAKTPDGLFTAALIFHMPNVYALEILRAKLAESLN